MFKAESKHRLLGEDLASKLDRLRWTNELPESFVIEHFAEIRNSIDYDTKRLIEESRDDSRKEKIKKDLNITRSCFIALLDQVEPSLLNKLHEASACLLGEAFKMLEKRVREFSAPEKEWKSSYEMDEAYLQLAMDIIDATNELERCLFDNQTIAYLPAIEKTQLGYLVYLSKAYLNGYERSILKCEKEEKFASIHYAVQASLNSSLAIKAHQPFLLTKNLLFIHAIIKLKKVSKLKILYQECMKKASVDSTPKKPIFNPYQAIKIVVSEYIDFQWERHMEAVRLSDLSACFNMSTSLNFSRNMLRRFEIDDSIVQRLVELDLGDNQLEALDQKMLAKGAKLKFLKMLNAFLPGTKYTLDFLSSLSNLTHLEVTLPDAPIDFEVFKNLQKLNSITLHSAASLDSNIERPKLTDEHFKKLSAMSWLTNMQLCYFEIEILYLRVLRYFSELNDFNLRNNKITTCDDSVLENSTDSNQFSKLRFVDLSQNRINHLRHAVFAKLLERLVLDHNLIKCIERGILNHLTQLNTLILDHNLIDSVEAGAFERLDQLKKLSIGNCHLREIDSRVFNSLKKLETLSLEFNQIEVFRVACESGEILVKGILSSAEYDLVKVNLFCGLNNLKNLSLNGNQLEELDLNCFCNLASLQSLDVSSNKIKKLNKVIRPGVLSNLIVLDLSRNQLTHIDRNAFAESRGLLVLKLFENKLANLEDGFFEPFEELMRLDLHGNNLSIVITRETFCQQMNCLIELNLLDNPSVHVEEGAFSLYHFLIYVHLEIQEFDAESSRDFFRDEMNKRFLSRLTNLTFANSSIESFDKRFYSLRELNLNQNQLRTINQMDPITLNRLTVLDLSGNLIEQIDDPKVFHNLVMLEKLNLSGNKLVSVDQSSFAALRRLESLDLSNNPGLIGLNESMFRELFGLKQLNLAGNNIVSLDFLLLFRSCRLLESLDLSDNQLDNESINETSMNGVTAQNLKELILANNRLERIDFVRNLYRLEKFSVRGNKIESITPDGINLFCRLVKLRHVDISDNMIQKLDIEAVFSHLEYQLNFLNLSNNPLNMNILTNNFSKLCQIKY